MRVFVTGAAGGIGGAIVDRAVSEGHQVVATDLDVTSLRQRFAETKQVETLQLDVRDGDDWERARETSERERPLDVVVNAAGILRPGRTGEILRRDVEAQIDVNVKGVVYGTNEMAKSMRRRRRGHIINIGSTASLFATPGNTVYAASKHAVRGFSIAAAGDLEPFGIAVTLLGPTATRTPMLELQRGREESALTFSGRRALEPSEVADAVFTTVLRKKPLELYLPARDHWSGKLAALMPRLALRIMASARGEGMRNFSSARF